MCENCIGAILHHICRTCFTKNIIFWQLKNIKWYFKRNLKKVSSATLFVITRHTYVSNMDTLSQTMVRGWSYLRHLTRNLYIFIDDWPFCEEVLWKFCQNLSLSFFLATRTHKRSPCQMISLFEYFFTFFYFVKKSQNGRRACSSKGVSFFKTIDGYVI